MSSIPLEHLDVVIKRAKLQSCLLLIARGGMIRAGKSLRGSFPRATEWHSSGSDHRPSGLRVPGHRRKLLTAWSTTAPPEPNIHCAPQHTPSAHCRARQRLCARCVVRGGAVRRLGPRLHTLSPTSAPAPQAATWRLGEVPPPCLLPPRSRAPPRPLVPNDIKVTL